MSGSFVIPMLRTEEYRSLLSGLVPPVFVIPMLRTEEFPQRISNSTYRLLRRAKKVYSYLKIHLILNHFE